MDCKRYKRLISDSATGLIDPARDLELRGHLARCENCRLALERQRSLLAAIDKTLLQTLAAEPSPQMLARIRDRIATGSFERRKQNFLPWPLAVATGCLALLVAGLVVWSIRRYSSARSMLPPNSASVAEKSAPSKPFLSTASGQGKNSRPVTSNSGLLPHGHKIAGTNGGHRRREQPYVLVERDEPALVHEFYDELHTNPIRAAPTPKMAAGVNGKADQFVAIAPLKIKPLTIAALDPGEGHEQHQLGGRRRAVE